MIYMFVFVVVGVVSKSNLKVVNNLVLEKIMVTN